jgi:hypothetical protein
LSVEFAGEKVLDLESDDDNNIWSKEDKQIAEEIVNMQGKHQDENGDSYNPIMLSIKDVIVSQCEMHHGQRFANPLTLVAFVENGDRPKPTVSDDDAPTAEYITDFTAYSNILPRSFIKRSIRVFCRDPSKEDLLRHAFSQWVVMQNHSADITPDGGFQVLPQGEASSGEESNSFPASGAMLTQDSDDEMMTPTKRPRNSNLDSSPSPIPTEKFARMY